MKLNELFESSDASMDVEQLANWADFKCKTESKTVSGKKYKVFRLTKNVMLHNIEIEYVYIVNQETDGWAFSAGLSSDKKRIDFDDGGDLTSLKKHLKKKKKLSATQIEEYLDVESDDLPN